MSQAPQVPFELESLSRANEYQKWLYRLVEPYLGKRILELGAGIGNMSRWLPVRERLILTENDGHLVEILKHAMKEKKGDDPRMTVRSLDLSKPEVQQISDENIDTIVSFNVLEHIEDDELALKQLSDLLRNSKSPGPRRLITLVPAHPWAYGAMDRSFGHFRRYTKGSWNRLHATVAPDSKCTMRYVNGFGLVGWVINGRILGKSSIGMGSIKAFELLCPYLSPIDDILQEKLNFPFGQSLLAILEWEPRSN